jgi:putative DNA primase/helicase
MIDQKESASLAGTGLALDTDNEAAGGALIKLDTTTSQPSLQHPPAPLPVIAGNIPEELKSAPQWVCWKYTLSGGRWTKPPYQPNGWKASKTNPAHFSAFSYVIAAYEKGDFSGIGFVLTADDPFVAIDIDHCLADGILTKEAEGIIKTMRSYTEISPSGTGIRIFVKASILRNIKKGIEIYSKDSYVTVTGQRWPR